jgi:hypothetical protein
MSRWHKSCVFHFFVTRHFSYPLRQGKAKCLIHATRIRQPNLIRWVYCLICYGLFFICIGRVRQNSLSMLPGKGKLPYPASSPGSIAIFAKAFFLICLGNCCPLGLLPYPLSLLPYMWGLFASSAKAFALSSYVV